MSDSQAPQKQVKAKEKPKPVLRGANSRPKYLSEEFPLNKILDGFYEIKIGGPADTSALALLGMAALCTAPGLAEYVAMAIPAGLSAVGACILARRALATWRNHFTLSSNAKMESSKAPDLAGKSGLCLGYTTDKAQPIYIPDFNLFRHMWIMGMSGMGKTVAGSLMMFQQIQRGGGVMFMDGKLDADNILAIYQFCAWCGRSQDFFVLNPGDAAMSNDYNPILQGDPDEVAARILSMIPSTEGNAGSDHYKQSANEALVVIIGACQAAKVAYNFYDLAVLMNNAKAMGELESKLRAKAPNSNECRNLRLFLDRYKVPANDSRNPLAGQLDMKRMKETLGGIAGRMFTFGTGSFGDVLNSYDPEVRMYDCIRDGKILYVALPTMGKDIAANNFGKMAMGDFRTALSWLQRNKADRPKIPFMAFLDEAASYVTESWAVVFEQARSAGVFLLPAIQTDSGFKAVSEDFAERVIGNTTTKMFFRVGTQQSADTAADLIGQTKRGVSSTSESTGESSSSQYIQISPQKTGGGSDSDGVSQREEEQHLLHADKLKSLDIGEAIVLYEGSKIYNLSIPFIGFDKATIDKIGPLRLNHPRKMRIEGLDFMGRSEEFLDAGREAGVNSKKGNGGNNYGGKGGSKREETEDEINPFGD
jgi:intracellular multiplication protein IcmO